MRSREGLIWWTLLAVLLSWPLYGGAASGAETGASLARFWAADPRPGGDLPGAGFLLITALLLLAVPLIMKQRSAAARISARGDG